MSSPRLGRYRDALNAISVRTRTPLPSLIVSFAVLHELTAIASLVGIFFSARALGVGERVVRNVVNDSRPGWVREKCRTWVEDGENWARRVGKRYGVFGLEKDDGNARGHLAGDLANAVVAYGVTKALLPVRIGLSMYLSPTFSRAVVAPFRQTVVRVFRR